MKKFIVFALCAISACSVFAEPFSMAKLNQLMKTNNYNAMKKYCYESEVSSESNYFHMYLTLGYERMKKGSDLTITEINDCSKKFNGFVKGEAFKLATANSLVSNNHCDEAMKIYKEIKNKIIPVLVFRKYCEIKNKEKIWQFGKDLLVSDGEGFDDYKNSFDILNKMFRYKPKSITKEQQIELLKQLSQIYPIPGTDFNKWKSFMGFVGFKYKALTGKDLF